MFWNIIECSHDQTKAVNNMLAIVNLYAKKFIKTELFAYNLMF